MLNFTYHVPTIIYFGKGQIKALEAELSKRAKKVLIITGRGSVKKHGIFDQVIEQVNNSGVEYVELSGVQPNPRLRKVYEGIELCRRQSVDFILAVGGGSVIDTAKTIAAGTKYEGDVWDFFEKDISPADALPVGTVLTLAASGSEMNPNAVITNEGAKRKVSMSSPLIRPVFSILDPEYTFTVDRYHTAAGVADIAVHIFEYYFSPVLGSDVQDRLAEALLKICMDYGPVVCDQPCNYNARANMMWASSLAISGITGRGKINDWVCHGIEHEVSAFHDVSHGVGLAILAPNWMEVTVEHGRSQRFVEYGVNVWGMRKGEDDRDIAHKAIDKTREFFSSLGLPAKLSELDISSEYFEEIASRVMRNRRNIEQFRQLSKREIIQILEMSL